MGADAWPVGDQEWIARYRTSMVGKHVPAAALEGRERELLGAVQETRSSAAGLFGDAEELALEDAADLATVDEAVRTSLGGGLRPALHEVGGTLMGIGIVTSGALVVRGDWSVDLEAAALLVGLGVLVVFVGWVVARALFASGRSAAAVGVGTGVVALGAAAITRAADLGAGDVVAGDVPLPLLVLGLVTPGVATLVLAHRMRQQELREDWDDVQWLRRFRGGLRARLVPAAAARGHVAEIEQALALSEAPAYAELGHPLALAHEMAAADRTSRVRLWAVSTVAAAGVPLFLSVVVVVDQDWGRLGVPVALAFALLAAGALVAGWQRRPWGKPR